MNSRLYTNTSNVKGIIGLVVLTVLTSYASTHATEIVDNTVKICKNGIETANEVIHRGKRQVAVIERHYDGRLHDTGKRIWISK